MVINKYVNVKPGLNWNLPRLHLWEGVGVCSYLLVSFWFTRIAANQSSLAAFLTNRVGDGFLTIGLFAILWSFGKKK